MEAPSSPDEPIRRMAHSLRWRRRRWWFVPLLCGLLLASWVWWKWGDGAYWWMENCPGSPFRDYDGLIAAAAERHGVDPYLLKAVVWQESRFVARATGAAGERGLMQITEIAAEDWVRAEQIETFAPTDLFDPHTNLEVGTWYLARALRRHANQPDPTPFALAEFNAGASRVQRWKSVQGEALAATEESAAAVPPDFLEFIDFPTTREYIRSVVARRDFYRRRGDFAREQSGPT